MYVMVPPSMQGSSVTVTATEVGTVTVSTVDTPEGAPNRDPVSAGVRSWTVVTCCGLARS